MRDTAQITKRPPRCFTKLMKAAGDLKAGSLGDIAGGKTGHFTHAAWGRHEHTWIPGHEIEVCTKCGTTRPKQSA